MSDSLINDYGSESDIFIQSFSRTIIVTEVSPSKVQKRSKTEWINEIHSNVDNSSSS